MAFARFTFNDGFFAELFYQSIKNYYLSTLQIMKRKNFKKYAELLVEAENATGRNEALNLIKKAAKLQSKLALSL